jgi:hypothetical protein
VNLPEARRKHLSAVRRNLIVLSYILIILLSVGAWSQNTPAAQPENSKKTAAPASAPADLSSFFFAPKIKEDWSTPALKGSDFAPADPVTYETDTETSFIREITRVRWRPSDPIDLYVIRPTGARKVPVIIYLYSYPFDADRFWDKNFCEFLTRDGFAAIGLSTFLTGQRYHDRGMTEWFVSEMRESLASSAHDVQLILNYLGTRPDLNLDMDHVGVFGDGSGATIAILAASVDPRIKTLDLLDPWGDWPEWMAKSTLVPEKERAGFLKPEFLAGIAPFDAVKVLPELHTQKIRLREIMTVTVTPNEAKKMIEAAAPANVEIARYKNSEDFRKAALAQGFDWIKQQLQPLPDRDQHDAVSQTSSAQGRPSQQ